MTRLRFPAALAAAALVSACDDPLRSVPVAGADSVQVAVNPNMVISAIVTFQGLGDSARVRYQTTALAPTEQTPAFALRDGADTVLVLGLLPQTGYALQLVVYGGAGSAADSFLSEPMVFASGALPADLPSYTASGAAPLSGYVVFSAAPYGIVIDRTGRVVWYKRFPGGGPGLTFMAQPTGAFVGRLVTDDTSDVNPMVEIDAAGFVRRELRCVGKPLRFHDLLLQADGSYWIMCDDNRVVDLTAAGGLANANVSGTAVQHVSASGILLFEWTPYDHIAFERADSALYAGVTNVNWTHGNAFDLDTDGNLVLCYRSLDQILKINTTTGAVMWRLGGRLNEFAITGAVDPGFARQHNVRVSGPGRLILLDNAGRGIGESRFERYLIDTVAMTAMLEQSYGSTPSVLTIIGGSVQGLAADRFLVSFGTQGRVEEFDASGTKLWAIDGNPGYVFRAQRIAALYAPVPATTR